MKKHAFGTHDIARICHVTPPTIGRWIEEGKLPSFKTAGGHRRVWDEDLVEFLKGHNIPVPPELKSAGIQRILIVDDEPEIRKFIRGVISEKRPESEILEAGDGFEAGHMIVTSMPKLVILDLKLPGVDGFKVCRTVRADPALAPVKILAITGIDADQSRAMILEAGADEFLAKPFTAEDLALKLDALIPQKTWRLG
jgi:excisionase family DNA binding protein